jgi:type IX secretion system PorP/SprF family membrane protein
MKKILLVVVCATAFSLSKAQQDPQFTNWMFDKVSFNPAAAGMEEMQCFTAIFRDQWDGFDRDPKTFLFNYDGLHPVKLPNIGVGFTAISDRLGQEKNTMIRGSGNYQIPVGSSKFSAGLSLGYYAKTLGKDWVYIDDNDLLIPDAEKSDGAFDLGIGVMMFQKDKYYAGISATHLMPGKLDKLGITTAQHFYLMGGYNYVLNNTITLRSNLLAKSDFKASILDVNVNVLWNNMLWAGVTFRPGDAFAPMLGYKYGWAKSGSTGNTQNEILIGYSYDSTTSDIKTYSAGSHEIFVKYCFTIEPIRVRALHGNVRTL